jgi:hypothetical protein
MSAWSSIISDILAAGTFTNYGSTPTLIILSSGSIRVRGTYITLEDEDEDLISDHTGKVLMKNKTGYLTIYAKNIDSRDDLEADVRSILQAQSSYSYEILGETPSVPQKNVYKYEMNIKILD